MQNVSTPSVGLPRWIAILIIVVIVLGAIGVLIVSNIDSLLNTGGSIFNFLFDWESRVDENNIVMCSSNSTCSIVHAILYSLIFVFVILTGFAYTTLLERKFIAWMQVRIGPNRVGPFGLLQPAADAVKLITKEDITPSGADKPVYLLAPILKAVPTLVILAVVPFGPDILVPWFDGKWYQVPLGLADLNVGVLWFLAITSIGTYGVVLAGWASNNKYAMLGGLRASAQMLSYELSLGLTMSVPILIVGSMSVGDIILRQTYFHEWFIFQNPLAGVILFIALLAEVNRAPFDLPEAEQELTAGYMTEYSGMKFGLIMMAEYVGMIGISAIVISLFFGGYQDGFGLVNSLPILAPIVMITKIAAFQVLMIWIRGTLPRIRYDRLMAFGWKVMLPLALIAVAWTAVALVIGDAFQNPVAYGIAAGIFLVLMVVFGYLLFGRERDARDEPALEDDPIITGEREGLGWVVLQIVGGLLAVPFVIYHSSLKYLDNLAAMLNTEDDKQAESSDKSVTSSGGD